MKKSTWPAVRRTNLLADLEKAQDFVTEMAEQIIDPLVVRVRFMKHAKAIADARSEITKLRTLVRDLDQRIHGDYDWNADPDNMTLRSGEVLSANNTALLRQADKEKA